MNSQQLTARDIFLTARAIASGPERLDYLRGACGENLALLRKVEALLRADEAAGSFLALPAAELDPDGSEPGSGPIQASTPPGLTESAGEVIGRYKLLQQIGEGGFGVVYMAEQREPVKRRVALKIIKLGMDTRQVIARFEAERQALALMDHPNIAKVLDGGSTDTGRPYFVMEYIKGVPILEYCDTEKLDTQQRLDLFTKVCLAIQHAHQKGIIHRDIKPSNVLITLHDGVPVPKVIDFGIAKATSAELTTRTLFTEHRQMIGTPAYMSPEQAEMSGLDIDTRSDIYSLGVLLYELLTGTTPFDTRDLTSKGYAEMMRIIREVEPHKPSTRLSSLGKTGTRTAEQRRAVDPKRLSQALKGDLDWIVMKCLEKDRTRRYETANSLAMDVRRYLGGEAVLAAPPSAAYQLRKFIRRHRGTVAAGAAVATALLIGVIAFALQAKIARDQRDLARQAQKTAEDAQAEAAAQQQRAEAERDRAERALTRAEWLVYAGKLTLAQNDFEDGNGGLALHYLGECPPQMRGWEWRYLWTRVNADRTLTAHTKPVSSVAFSPDGGRIATGSEDGTAKLWDVASGRELFTLAGHVGYVMSLAFSPDGKHIVTGGGPWGQDKPGEVKVWDTATGQMLHDLVGHADCVWSVAVSPDGQRIVSGGGDWAHGPGEVKVWSAETGQETLSLPKQAERVMCVTFSPDGEHIASGGADSKVHVWDAATGQAVRVIEYNGGVWCATYSPDGKRIIAGSSDTTVKIWDAATAKERLTLYGHTDWLRSVAFSPDGKRIATTSADQTTRVWDAATARQLFALKGHSGIVRSVAFSPDGARIVTGSNDGTARIWNAQKGQEVPTLKGHLDFVSSIAFSPDGRRIVTGSNDKTVKFWDAATRQVLLTLNHTDAVSSVAFSPDGNRIATGSGQWGRPDAKPGEAKLWDAATGQELLALKPIHCPIVTSVAFSPDGHRVVTGGEAHWATEWDATSGQKLLTLKGHTAVVWSVAFGQDGERIVTGSLDGTAKLWDAKSGRELLTLTGHTAAVRSVAFSPDGSRIVTGSDDRSAKLWDAGTGQELLALKAHPTEVWSVAFSPDGQRLVTGVAGANAIAKVWYAAPTSQPAAGGDGRR